MDHLDLKQENKQYQAGGGVSAGNRNFGFQPAFCNTETGQVCGSFFADGRPSPIHVIHGSPDSLVATRSSAGKVTSVKASVVSGFTLNGRFYSREEVAQYVRALSPIEDGQPEEM
jgi:hypothetical protein